MTDIVTEMERSQRVVDVNCALARALNLDPEHIKHIRLDVDGDHLPLVTVQFNLRGALADDFTSELSAKYHLVPIEDDTE